VKEIQFTSEITASRATHASLGRYRLSPREAYVLRSAPIRGLSQAIRGRRLGEAAKGGSRTIWMVRDEDLSNVVEGLLQRGFLARRGAGGPAYADLTAEGRVAIEARQTESFR
jgi:hypothetical protein